jgi:hypothetical protein
MRQITRVAASLTLLFACAAMASAAPNGNDSVDYAPQTKQLAGTFPFDRSYDLDISAPTSLNKDVDITQGIAVDLRVVVNAFPPASSAAEAASLVSLGDQSMVFYAFGETHRTKVYLNVPAGTTPGDYQFTIQTKGPSGIGWGNSGHTLQVTVSEPVAVDTTPPAVVIDSPANGAAITFCSAGTVVPVTISATDGESFVTTVWAAANSQAFAVSPFMAANEVTTTGSFTAGGIGAYALKAWARSAAPEAGESDTVNISVNYTMSWLPPLSTKNVFNGALAIKFAAHDCEGNFVADNRVRVEVWEGNEPRFGANFGDGSAAVRIEDGHYVANYQPAPGVHNYTVRVLFGGFEQASKNFTSR